MQLYNEALELTKQGKNLEAKTLMERLAAKYPGTASGQRATKDLYILDALLKSERLDRQRLVHSTMKRVSDALTRYRGKHGEYPRRLDSLVPDYLEQSPETPWNHPFFYRPFVSSPILDVKDKRGQINQVFSSKFDNYYLVCLGVDLQPGGEELAADTFVLNGEFVKTASLPMIPLPQPVR